MSSQELYNAFCRPSIAQNASLKYIRESIHPWYYIIEYDVESNATKFADTERTDRKVRKTNQK